MLNQLIRIQTRYICPIAPGCLIDGLVALISTGLLVRLHPQAADWVFKVLTRDRTSITPGSSHRWRTGPQRHWHSLHGC